jgi:hypothetical protein
VVAGHNPTHTATRIPFPAKTHLPAGADTLFGNGDDAAQLGTRLLGQVSYSENPRCPCRALSFLSRQKPSVDSSTRTRVNESGIRNSKGGDHQRITAHKAWVLELPAGVNRCVRACLRVRVLQSSEFRCRRRAQTWTPVDRTHLIVDRLGTVQIRATRLAATSAGPGHAVRQAWLPPFFYSLCSACGIELTMEVNKMQ